jgi:tryptophan 2,3-dioxygenase
VGSRFGEEGRKLSYGTYVKVPELLALQHGLSEEHDELLFIVAHQVYELWFKVVLFELEAARDRIDAGDLFFARHSLRRVHVVERLLIEQIDVLETMSPQDFLAFRSQLAPASGFQSVQFREIEFLSGLKEPKYLARIEATPDEVTRLHKRLEEPVRGSARPRRGVHPLACPARADGGAPDRRDDRNRPKQRRRDLRTTLGKRFYPELWDVRSQL